MPKIVLFTRTFEDERQDTRVGDGGAEAATTLKHAAAGAGNAGESHTRSPLPSPPRVVRMRKGDEAWRQLNEFFFLPPIFFPAGYCLWVAISI